MENVAALVKRHGKTFKKVLKFLKTQDYHVYFKLLNTADFAVPHQRNRVLLVGIKKNSLKRCFKWPVPQPNVRPAHELLDAWSDKVDHARRLPTKPMARDRVLAAVAAARAKGIHAGRAHLFVDVDCSARYLTWGHDELKTITATRGAVGGPWITSRGRRTSITELFRFLGTREEDPECVIHHFFTFVFHSSGGFVPRLARQDYPGWETVVSARAMGHMLGNAVSGNIAELVLAEAFWAAGLVSAKPRGRWAGQ